jgi:hypothetical protein
MTGGPYEVRLHIVQKPFYKGNGLYLIVIENIDGHFKKILIDITVNKLFAHLENLLSDAVGEDLTPNIKAMVHQYRIGISLSLKSG